MAAYEVFGALPRAVQQALRHGLVARGFLLAGDEGGDVVDTNLVDGVHGLVVDLHAVGVDVGAEYFHGRQHYINSARADRNVDGGCVADAGGDAAVVSNKEVAAGKRHAQPEDLEAFLVELAHVGEDVFLHGEFGDVFERRPDAGGIHPRLPHPDDGRAQQGKEQPHNRQHGDDGGNDGGHNDATAAGLARREV